MTKAVHDLLRRRAREMRESWSEGMNWTSEARVAVEAYEAIADIEYEELEDDDE